MRKKIVTVGSALVDLLVKESDSFVADSPGEKGGMTLVDAGVIDALLKKTDAEPVVVSGGSACNTAIGVARLGGAAGFVGKCGTDRFGKFFTEDLIQNSVDPVLFESDLPTGRVLSVITPDSQRTMFTYLGAAGALLPDDITRGCFQDAGIVHVEGYLLHIPGLTQKVLACAKECGAMVSLDLASFTVVEAFMDILPGLIEKYVDILIANEDEARAYTGHTEPDAALSALFSTASIAVLKLGEKGSMVATKDGITKIPPAGEGDVVDTTGAGDLWAAGFLFGLAHGLSLQECGRLASACGYEVCRVIGARIDDSGWKRITSGCLP